MIMAESAFFYRDTAKTENGFLGGSEVVQWSRSLAVE